MSGKNWHTVAIRLMVKFSSVPTGTCFDWRQTWTHCRQRPHDWVRQPETLTISDVSFRPRLHLYVSHRWSTLLSGVNQHPTTLLVTINNVHAVKMCEICIKVKHCWYRDIAKYWRPKYVIHIKIRYCPESVPNCSIPYHNGPPAVPFVYRRYLECCCYNSYNVPYE